MDNPIKIKLDHEIEILEAKRSAILSDGDGDENSLHRVDHALKIARRDAKAVSTSAMDDISEAEYARRKRAFLHAAGDNKLPSGGNFSHTL
jgi:hypothetical protein